MHLEVYKLREDVNAVIHAHPPKAIGFSLAQVSLAQCILPEVILSLGSIPITKYATPTTYEGAVVIRDYIKDYDALILDRHGSLTVGKTLMDAYNNLERIEHVAEITLCARQLGTIKFLPENEVNKLISLGEKLGIKGAKKTCCKCGGCGRNKGVPFSTKMLSKGTEKEEELVSLITNEVLNQIS